MVDHCVQYVLRSELQVTANVQEIFRAADSWLVRLSEFLGPASLGDYVIPILGLTTSSMGLMGEATFMLALLNVMSSVFKWTFPHHRPYWWIREYDVRDVTIDQSLLTCDTTAGFPSSHSMAFTGLTYILLLHTNLPSGGRYLATIAASIPMWICRVYFGSHFLHQCICGSLVAVLVIDTIRRRQWQRQPNGGEHSGVVFIQSWGKTIAVGAVAAVALFVIGMYFVMLYAGLDPHWSVRMAFKWCTDPKYLRHETSPIFVICRDLGFLMGVALSSPLSERLQRRLDPMRSVPMLVVVMAVNFYVRKNTPKDYGRVVFVGYEFLRNTFHSVALLTVVPKFCAKAKVKKSA